MDISLSSVLIAFSGGVLMFLAPCTLPLVPAFLASLVPPQFQKQLHPYELPIRAFLFTAGFTIVFVLLGILAGIIGGALVSYKTMLGHVAGFFIVLFGLSLLQVVRIPNFLKEIPSIRRLSLNREKRSTAGILGALFAFGWTPCAGPILASILLFTSQSTSIITGGFLLFIFSLGLGVPFILVGLLYGRLVHRIYAHEWYARAVQVTSGILLVILGLVLLFGQSFLMTELGFRLYSFLGYVPMCTYF